MRIQLGLGSHLTGASVAVMMEMTMPGMILVRKTGVGHSHSRHQKPDEKHRGGCQSGSATVETERHGGFGTRKLA